MLVHQVDPTHALVAVQHTDGFHDCIAVLVLTGGGTVITVCGGQ